MDHKKRIRDTQSVPSPPPPSPNRIDYDFDNYLNVMFEYHDNQTTITIDEPVLHQKFMLGFIVISSTDDNDVYSIHPSNTKRNKLKKQQQRQYTLTIPKDWSNKKIKLTSHMQSLDYENSLDVEIMKTIVLTHE